MISCRVHDLIIHKQLKGLKHINSKSIIMNKTTAIRVIVFSALVALTLQANIQQIQSKKYIEIDVTKVKPSPKPKPKPTPNYHGGGSSSGSSIFFGFILGPILFISSFPCIWYNQRKAAIQHRRLTLAQNLCLDVDVTSEVSAMSTNNQLVYAKGESLTTYPLYDSISGVGGSNLLKISRSVQVLEWRKKTRKNDNQQQIYYQLQWSSGNSETQGQHYNSPLNWFIHSQTTYNQNSFLGGYNLSQQVLDLCTSTTPFQLQQYHIDNILMSCNKNDRTGQINGEYIYFKVNDNSGYVPPSQYDESQNNNGDGAGTLRVKYSLCPTGPISLIGQSKVEPNRGTFKPYDIAEFQGTKQTSEELELTCCFCFSAWKHLLIPQEEILIVKEEITTKENLFKEAFSKSKTFTVIIRVLAYCLMVLGILLFFSPITEILGYIPLVGGFVKGVAGFAIFIGAVLACIPLFLIMFSVAWLRFHPKMGVIALSVGLLILLIFWMTSPTSEEE